MDYRSRLVMLLGSYGGLRRGEMRISCYEAEALQKKTQQAGSPGFSDRLNKNFSDSAGILKEKALKNCEISG